MRLTLIGAASLLPALLAGCVGDMEGYVVTAAQSACKDHGGIHTLYSDVFARHAKCNDGALMLDLQHRPKVAGHQG